ncbi:hypothetical protein GAP32_444 [Cronobacter phage vB_CsaM_GAP32]|uniref:Uncharacterized protein n=1 Tax=Cronobacter phage vB_CsaM_GAP32 TaxID=1141136 RepID=K4FB84_9CAUD|nr:hypothetical protein GAP32_444 [Cronobacter phage vB_CsaM_GAP32]AFC21899.1 hypothetical protein GAP32_444 [Cronobacter phage vB_CsaM_GAP32]
MHKAVLIFEHTWYQYDGDYSRTETEVLTSDTEQGLDKLIKKITEKTVRNDYGDFGLMTHTCVLKSTERFETK